LHAGGTGSFDAGIGVLEDETFFRGDAEPLGRDEKGIGVRLALAIVLGADDGVEFIDDAEAGESAGNDGAVTAGSDGDGEAAVDLVDDLDDGLDGSNALDALEVEFLLVAGGLLDWHVGAVAFVEDFDDAFGGNATQFVE